MADEPAMSAAATDDSASQDGHARIARLAEELLPALIARLSASSLGELEVREGTWRVRLRRAPERVEADEPTAGRSRGGGRGHTGGASADGAVDPTAVGGARAAAQPQPPRDTGRVHATSPAVGYYSPRDGSGVGQAVRAGDVVGHIDVLGVRQEVVSPADGRITRQLAEPGEAVEYGQELVRLERLVKGGPRQVGDAEAVAVAASFSSESVLMTSPIAASASAVGGAGLTNGTTSGTPRTADAGLVATTGAAPDPASS